MINKVVGGFDEAIKDVFDGAVILFGGFSDVGGNPGYLLKALAKHTAKNLTIVGQSPAIGRHTMEVLAGGREVPDWYCDAGPLMESGRIKKIVLSVIQLPIAHTNERPIVKALQRGYDVEIELVPMGTIAERIRAARAGIPAFYSPVGAGTYMAKGKESRTFGNRECILEYALKGDFSFIRAYKADRYGNLIYKGTGRSFNATMAGASMVTIAEVDEIVELGSLDPEIIVTPSVYVDRVVARPRQ
jgi:3-oxoadipate CoA-transferase, alpha subunit